MVGFHHASAPQAIIWIIAISVCLRAEAAAQVDYLTEVKPILNARCYACHGALKQEAGLRLDTGRLIRKGGESGQAIVSENPDRSRLIERVTAADESVRMPPDGDPLTASQITSLEQWIAEGAPSPDDEAPETDPKSHWAFQPPVRPDVPSTGDPEIDNPIDAFLKAQQTEHQILVAERAEKHRLLRRVTLDLIGLPPTRDQLHAFLADDSPTAYARVVDRLLSDSRHGERWARHWMDVWRYSDWYGRRHVPDVWNSAPQIWRWRDWIVRSLNADHGYDRMVQEMLAADEICPQEREAVVATGYLVRNWYALNPNDWMRSTVEHTGRAFLGLTFQCAHCHDHKYDPITQEDYFALRAFFEPIYVRQDRVVGEADPGPFQDYEYSTLRKIQRLGTVSVFDKSPDAPTWFYTGGDERNRLTERGSIAPGLPSFLAKSPLEPHEVDLPVEAWYPGLRSELLEAMRADLRQAIVAAERKVAQTRKTESAPSSDALNRLAIAERKLSQAIESARESGTHGALAGKQSLFFDATKGRRIVNNDVSELQAPEDGTLIEFQLLLQTPVHFNFQLARDSAKGLTAGYVGFDEGRIVSYQPGSFTEFEVGSFDFAAGQSRFHVQLELQITSDQCLLSVRSLTDDALLVDRAPVALNGWNPAGDPTKAITFDARIGSVAVIDDLRILAPQASDSLQSTATPLLVYDFESPQYREDLDVAGTDGWTASSFCSGQATSLVRTSGVTEAIREAQERLAAADRAVRLATLPGIVAQSRVAAAQADLDALNARILAEQARVDNSDGDDRTDLSQAASRLEREAAVRKAEADVLARELALATAEATSANDADGQKEVDDARGEFATARESLEKAVAALGDESRPCVYSPLSPEYPRTSTGRRKALALWITDRSNALTARVAVNHIWLRHFHAPLVATVDNFGRSGAAPTHPELLDWLAVEFMESGWSMKHLHRLIVTSKAYQRRSSFGETRRSPAMDDSENFFLGRMNAGRMESEVVRDSLLALGGLLDESIGGQELENEDSMTTTRRSLYYATYPEQGGKSPLGELFDGPDALACYRRTRSIVPQQALALTNSDLVHNISQRVAVRIWSEVASDDKASEESNDRFIRAAFEHVLSRPPSSRELRTCHDFLHDATARTDAPDVHDPVARESLLRALLNHNDFQTIR